MRGLPEMTDTMVCRQCENALCSQACPTGAIRLDAQKQIIRINYEDCVSCKVCMQACPYGAIKFDPKLDRVFKCELCDGNPVCLDRCPAGAISIQEGPAADRDTITAQLEKYDLCGKQLYIK